MTRQTITRSMQVSALLLFLLGIFMAYYMATVQSSVLWPAYGEYRQSLNVLNERIAAGAGRKDPASSDHIAVDRHRMGLD